MAQEIRSPQLLHPVFGGELERLDDVVFEDVIGLDVAGVFPNCAAAHAAWKKQLTVDDAQARYFVHPHRLLDPAGGAATSAS